MSVNFRIYVTPTFCFPSIGDVMYYHKLVPIFVSVLYFVSWNVFGVLSTNIAYMSRIGLTRELKLHR